MAFRFISLEDRGDSTFKLAMLGSLPMDVDEDTVLDDVGLRSTHWWNAHYGLGYGKILIN